MRALLFSLLCAVVAAGGASAQSATLVSQVVHRESGAPLAYATVSIVSQDRELLTNEAGQLLLSYLAPGELRLRFKRIGFVPTDTVLTLAANDTVRIRIEMTRLVLRLPAILVSGRCTNESPRESKPAILAQLFDQVQQNAERMKLLAGEKPFLMHVRRVRGIRTGDRTIAALRVDTIVRRPMPRLPYEPKRVIRPGEGVDAGEWVVALPELPDIADTAFTNNHCFRYAGQTRFGTDSVIEVAFEPVPRLDRDVDIQGTLYLRVDDYQLVGSVTALNRIPARFRRSGLREYTVRARFGEIVSGVPVLEEWELTNRFRSPRRPIVEIGQLFFVQWTDSTGAEASRDTLSIDPRVIGYTSRAHRDAVNAQVMKDRRPREVSSHPNTLDDCLLGRSARIANRSLAAVMLARAG